MVEMLVSASIIALLAALVFANYHSGEKQYALGQANQQLISDIRRAQNMSISGAGIAQGQYYGYGIYAKAGDAFYIIYGEKNGDKTYQSSVDAVIETINLSNKMNIKSPASADIFFESPDPTTYIGGDKGVGVSSIITLQSEDGLSTKSVRVTTTGQIMSQ